MTSRLFLTSSYDSTLRVYSSSSPTTPLHTLSGHDQSVLSVCWCSSPSSSNAAHLLASGGMDRSVRVWRVPSNSGPAIGMADADVSSGPHAVYVLPLHTAPVASVRASSSPSRPQLLTASWDSLIGLWDLAPSPSDSAVGEGDVDESERKAKRRRKAAVNGDVDALKRKEPAAVFKAHKGTVSRAIFGRENNGKAYSAGWDHTVRRWDLETGACELTKVGVFLFISRKLRSKYRLPDDNFQRRIQTKSC